MDNSRELDSEYQEYLDDLDAEQWDKECKAMKVAEQTFGYYE